MPLTVIEVCRPRNADEVRQLMEAVYDAQIEALGVPATDRQIRCVQLAADHVLVPPGRTQNFTIVTVQLFAGRSTELKRALYRAIVKRFELLGIAPTDVFIGLVESPRENWSMSGGIAACDL